MSPKFTTKPKIWLGFEGTSPSQPTVTHLIDYIRHRMIEGVVLFSHNIEAPKQLKALTKKLRQTNEQLSIAVDQEGGKVQRLKQENGFTDYPSALDIGQSMSPKQAIGIYAEMAAELADYNINVNLAPVVDLYAPEHIHNPLQKNNRCYAQAPAKTVKYAAAFIGSHNRYKILTVLKHFPGHGFAQHDTHAGLVDVTKTHQAIELQPFEQLIKTGLAKAIMPAHVTLKSWDENLPISLSQTALNKLRQNFNFNGLLISDDFHMSAIAKYYSLEETFRLGVRAGLDVLMFSNNPLAAKNNPEFEVDECLPEKIARIEV